MSEIDGTRVDACIPDLPYDVVCEILKRVSDVVSLFRCNLVCKKWGRIMADQKFLESCRLLMGDRSSLLGFFVQRHQLRAKMRRKKVPRINKSRALAFIPVPESPLGPGLRHLTCFIRDDVGFLNDAKPLVIHDGLLLLRILPKPSDKNIILRLCMCNMNTGKHDFLPRINSSVFGDDGPMGYAILTAKDHSFGQHQPADGYSTFFRVLVIGVHHINQKVYLGDFSSDAPTNNPNWRIIQEHLDDGLHGCRTMTIFKGGTYWLFHGDADRNGPNGQRFFTFGVSINTTARHQTFDAVLNKNQVQWSAWLCTRFINGDVNLCLLLVNDRRLEIWGNGAGEDEHVHLVCTHSIHVGSGELGLFGVEPVCLTEKSGTMLVLYNSDLDHAYLLDIHSGSTTMVAGWRWSLNYRTAVPYEINWLEFFMCRLGVQQQ